MTALPEGADALYALDPSAFVAERDALARALRARGEVAGSDQVKRLRRPTTVAAALNRSARQHPELVDQLVAAGEAMGAAQAAAVGGDRDALRAASRGRREAVRRLADVALDLAGPTHADAITATLEAAALDAEVASLLRAGRLTKEVPAPSAFGFAGVPDDLPARPVVDHAAVERRRDAEAEVALAESKLASAEAALADAEHAVTTARRALDDARALLTALD